MKLSSLYCDGEHVDSFPPSKTAERRARPVAFVIAAVGVALLLAWVFLSGDGPRDYPNSQDYPKVSGTGHSVRAATIREPGQDAGLDHPATGVSFPSLPTISKTLDDSALLNAQDKSPLHSDGGSTKYPATGSVLSVRRGGFSVQGGKR